MSDPFFQPVSGFDLPRFAGVPTFMRLPYVAPGHDRFEEVQIGLIGVPWDSGTTNRPGPSSRPAPVARCFDNDPRTTSHVGHAAPSRKPIALIWEMSAQTRQTYRIACNASRRSMTRS